MRFLCVVFALSAAVVAGAGERIAVLDLGVPAGVTNRFGCASSPQAFVRALGTKHDVRIVPHAQMFEEGAFDNARTDLLVLPAGSLFPETAAAALVGYLKRGGLLLTCGGYAFDEPMKFVAGRWTDGSDVVAPPPACGVKLGTPPLAAWRVDASESDLPTELGESRRPDGHAAIRIATKGLRHFNAGIVPFPSGAAREDRGSFGFDAKGGAGTEKFRVEITERDGTRWWCPLELGGDWRTYRLCWADFQFHRDSPTAKTRGKAGDRIRFENAVRVMFSLCHRECAPQRPHEVWVANLTTGRDPDAHRRVAAQGRVRINHRHYGEGFFDQPRPDQIAAFSPAYAFADVPRIENDAFWGDLFPAVSLKGSFAGWDASAMLTPQINAHASNRAVLRPVLACRGSDGRLLGRAASLVFHYDGIFKGSAWALFGVGSEDLFATPANDALLLSMTEALFRRTFLARTRPAYDCYRPGETMSFSTEAMNLSGRTVAGEVGFTVFDEAGRVVHSTNMTCSVAAKGRTKASFAWKVPQDGDDLYRVVAEFRTGGGVADREENAIAVWNEKTVANGPKLGVDGTYFTIDGRKRFWFGAQMFLARQQSYTSASALRFYREFKAIRAAGMRISRNFFGWNVDLSGKGDAGPGRERLLRLMDACVVLSQKFGIVNYFNPVCGNDIPRTLDGIAAEARDVEMFARRYGKVPGFMMDVRNEARLPCPERALGKDPMSDAALAEAFRTWAQAVADAARRGRPDLVVSTGWSQGWGWGSGFKDPPTAALPFSFTDCHYYGPNMDILPEIKKVDQRVLGRPAVMGEFGVAFHPERIRFSSTFADEREAARRYRGQPIRAFGAGFAFVCNYGWTDLVEGNTTFAFCHWDGNPRPALDVYRHVGEALSGFDVRERRPDAVLVLDDGRFEPGERRKGTFAVCRRAIEALSWWGADYSVLPACVARDLPGTVKLTIRTDELVRAGFGGLNGDPAAERAAIGAKLKVAGASFTRRPQDPDTLETYRVDGVGETAWAFWNDGESGTCVERGGHCLTIGPGRGGLMRISDSGELRQAVEL